MQSEVITRLFWTAGVILAGLAAYIVLTRLVLARAARAAQQNSSPFAAETPALLYFTTPECAPCRTVQRPAITRVKQILGESLKVIEVNAQEQPDLARAWGVLSVPTTFILDRSGKPLYVNHGITPADKLLRQMNSVL